MTKEKALLEAPQKPKESISDRKRVSKCKMCGRKLTDPVSVKRGIGPICFGKASRENGERSNPRQEFLITNCQDIILERTPSGIRTNVLQSIVYHSPSGFEWGYGGSGPADLALNILAMFVDKDTAFRLHQEFKWQFIASMPFEGGTIKRDDILAWLRERGVR